MAGLLGLNFAGGLASNLGSSGIGTAQLFANTTYQFVDNLTISKGRHMMKTGFQLLRQQINSFYAGNNGRTGFIEFNGQYTRGPGSNGLADADFFLGFPRRLGRGVDTGTWGHRKNIVGVYFQDDWRAIDTLTLNLGVRWEYHTPLHEVRDRQSNFSPFTGELQLPGENGNSRALYNGFWKDWQPRIGFAWTPGVLSGGKTVLRGAYTVSSFMEGTGTNLRMPLNPPFNVEFETIYDSPAALQTPQSRTSQGLTVLQQLDPFRNVNIRLWDPNVRPANVQQWSLILERQFQDTVVTAGYVGQHGTHLVVPMPYFQRQLLSDGTTKPAWLDRLARVIRAADERGMIVNLLYFYQGQDEIFESDRAIVNAARGITLWLVENNFRNVVIDIANEWDLKGETWDQAAFIPENITGLVEVVREQFNGADFSLPIGASTSGRMAYPASLARLCDVVLIHGNGRPPGEKLARLREFEDYNRTVWMTEDDNGRETTHETLVRELASADALFDKAAGWGYMPWVQAQQFPFVYMPGESAEFTDDMPVAQRDPAYFKAVLEHIASLVLRKPPVTTVKKKK